MNLLDQRGTNYNAVNAKDMDKPKPNSIRAPGVSNALAAISPSNAEEKKNQTMPNVFSVMVTTQ